ncbi:double-strand-break repair protein rad21-like protein 1 [Nelusetta ayraudi]|uniref:double-strand-break repair protein rad21-like protein 1 n=1 Tax=Nelusetta ayraudi TaxID=303726 RepID=UPI003F701E4D
MFFAQLFTAKKGPLAKIWLAAHWDRKLTKAHVFECNLESTVIDIISPQMKMGLRTSSHLLVGVVRIYSRKTKYLLADCSEALVKIRVAFRPDQTDLAVDGLEATVKAITLIEDFTAFDTPLPDLSAIDAVDHFSLNQCRPEEITLKEDLGNQFMDLVDFGDESHIGQTALLDMSLQSLRFYDGFGDEDKGYDLLDFLALSSDPEESTLLILNPPQTENSGSSALRVPRNDSDRMEVEALALDETPILLTNNKAFALEPVLTTSNSRRKRGRRKRKLFVDQKKELSNDTIKEQLTHFSDLIVPMDLAPPTEQLMLWKESGGAHSLFTQPCSTVLAPQINALFSETIFQVNISSMCEEEEEEEEKEATRRHSVKEGQGDVRTLATDGASVVNSLLEGNAALNSVALPIDQTIDGVLEDVSKPVADDSCSEGTHSELPSEDSMLVHQSTRAEDPQATPPLPFSKCTLMDSHHQQQQQQQQQPLSFLLPPETLTSSLAGAGAEDASFKDGKRNISGFPPLRTVSSSSGDLLASTVKTALLALTGDSWEPPLEAAVGR